MNRPSFSTKMMLLVGLLMAIPAFTSPANAEPTWSCRFVLPYEVTWGKVVLPAGEYTIRIGAKNSPVVITSMHGTKSYFASAPIIADSEAGSTRILVTTADGRHIVRELSSPSDGVAFVFAPFSKAERETMAKDGQVESIPVMVSKR
jgi:hypothetical protein